MPKFTTVMESNTSANSNASTKFKKKAVAIIPAFNEEQRISNVIIQTLKYVDNVIVVNDCSIDKTSAVAMQLGAQVINLPLNSGAGYATREGCDAALLQGAEIIVTIDADGQHNPDEIPKLVNKLVDENVDIVFGFRPRDQNMPIINKLGGTMLYTLSYLLFSVKIKDTQTGFHAFTASCYPKLRWNSNRYAFVSEFIYRIYESKLTYAEVPVQTIYTGKTGGMRKRDGIKSLILMMLWRFRIYHILYKLID